MEKFNKLVKAMSSRPYSADTVIWLYSSGTQCSSAVWQEHYLTSAQLGSNREWLEQLYSSCFNLLHKSMVRLPFEQNQL